MLQIFKALEPLNENARDIQEIRVHFWLEDISIGRSNYNITMDCRGTGLNI
jgi:hypothetical protein